jgi:uncharacterized membrane protein HdeD (DUF308 family)
MKDDNGVEIVEVEHESSKVVGVDNDSAKGIKGIKIVYYILGVLEALFAFRLVFKLLGANPNSGFVSFIYAVTQVFLAPFTSIFRTATTQGIETKAVLEPMTIIAMIVYALIAWGIVKLIVIIKSQNSRPQ